MSFSKFTSGTRQRNFLMRSADIWLAQLFCCQGNFMLDKFRPSGLCKHTRHQSQPEIKNMLAKWKRTILLKLIIISITDFSYHYQRIDIKQIQSVCSDDEDEGEDEELVSTKEAAQCFKNACHARLCSSGTRSPQATNIWSRVTEKEKRLPARVLRFRLVWKPETKRANVLKRNGMKEKKTSPCSCSNLEGRATRLSWLGALKIFLEHSVVMDGIREW